MGVLFASAFLDRLLCYELCGMLYVVATAMNAQFPSRTLSVAACNWAIVHIDFAVTQSRPDPKNLVLYLCECLHLV